MSSENNPHAIRALEILVNSVVSEDGPELDFEQMEAGSKRLVVQLQLIAARSGDPDPDQVISELYEIRQAVDDTPDHALRGIFRNDIISRVDDNSLTRATTEILDISTGTSSHQFFTGVSESLEHFTEFEATEGNSATVKYREINDDRRVSGTYLTPLPLANSCVEEAVESAIERQCTSSDCWTGSMDSIHEGGQEAASAITSLNLVDPACGTGSMLLAALNVLSPILAKVKTGTANPPEDEIVAARGEIVRHCLYGVDANQLSRDVTLAVLWTEGKFRIDESGVSASKFVTGDSLLGPVRQNRITDTANEAKPNGNTYRQQLRPVNWGEEFDTVFTKSGGFDVVVTNPPWERLKVQTREFFAGRNPELATVATTADREVRLENDKEAREALEYAKESARQFADDVRSSPDYEYTNSGGLNLYSLFCERSLQIIAKDGFCGLLVPTGIATDYYTREFFEHLVSSGKLESFHDFENRKKHFSDIDGRTRFALVTLDNSGGDTSADFVFFAHDPEDLRDASRHVVLDIEDISSLNPNTKTAPLVRGHKGLKILQKQHEVAPILSRETEDGDESPWTVRYKRMFDMSLDSDYFEDADDISHGERGNRGTILADGNTYMRVYEGRMVSQYNHRASHAKDAPENLYRSGTSEDASKSDLSDPSFTVSARYYVSEESVEEKLNGSNYDRDWFIGFKDITSATNARTMIASVLPYTAVGNKLPLLLTNKEPRLVACLLANLNSMAYDFACRQKIGNVTLNWYILRQTPIHPPERYNKELGNQLLRDWISQRVAQLTYTASDLDEWGSDLEYEDTPYHWDEEVRRSLRVDLDAMFFHLYDLTRDEVDHVLDSFTTVAKREKSIHGDYKLKREILDRYDELSETL